MDRSGTIALIGALSAAGLLIVSVFQFRRAEYWQKLDRSKAACADYVDKLDAFVIAADDQRSALEVHGISGVDAEDQVNLIVDQAEARKLAERSFLRAFGDHPPARLQVLRAELDNAAILRRFTSQERGHEPLPDYELAAAKFLSECLRSNVKG